MPRTNPVIAEILRQGAGQPRKYVLAALATGRVESNFQNLPGGDADSQGWRQERASLYADPRNLTASVQRFYREARQHDRGQAAGELAADVQRPAAQYRGRYAQHLGEARQLLGGAGWRPPATPPRSGGAGTGTVPPGGGARAVTTRTPGVDNRKARASLLQSFLQDDGDGDIVNYALKMRDLRDVPGSSSTRTVRTPAGGGAGTTGGGGGGGGTSVTGRTGTADFEGKKVAAWIAPILRYARRQGWQGQLNSGFRSRAEQERIYNSGVRPAAVPGTSRHEGANWPRGAVDVSDAQQLSDILRRSRFRRKLIYAGAKDPVHFSHPSAGGY